MAETPKQDPTTPTIHPDTIPVPGAAGQQAIDMLDRHRNLVIAVVAFSVVGVLGTVVLKELKRQKISEASQAFSTAADERSIEKLDAVAADYPDSIAAGNAMITKAEIQLAEQKFEDARISFLTFVEKYPKHPRQAQGIYALGNLSHESGDLEKALEFYDRALSEGATADLGPLLLIRKGDIALAQAESLRQAGKEAEAEEKINAAKQSYEESITRPEFRASPFIEMAETRLALADIGDVPVVPAPPEPEPETAPEPALLDPLKEGLKPAVINGGGSGGKPAGEMKTETAPKKEGDTDKASPPANEPPKVPKPKPSPPAPAPSSAPAEEASESAPSSDPDTAGEAKETTPEPAAETPPPAETGTGS